MRALAAVTLVALALASCQSSPPETETETETEAAVVRGVPDDGSVEDIGSFSSRRAGRHLEVLSEIGPRASGTRRNARARSYITRELEALGVAVEQVEMRVELPEPSGPAARSGERTEPAAGPPHAKAVQIVTTLPGRSPDRFLLVAPYDGGAEGDVTSSAAALLLELARALSERPRAYTVMLVFLDGDSLAGRAATRDGRGEPVGTPGDDGSGRAPLLPGSAALARHLAEGGRFESVRFGVFFGRVGSRPLRIVRDLHSHHVYRDVFWDAAAALDQGSVFRRDAPRVAVVSGHRAFVEAGLNRVVAITAAGEGDYGTGVGAAVDLASSAARRVASPESVAAVGEVTLEALDRVAARLARIDRFRDSPLEDPAGTVPLATNGSEAPGPPVESPGVAAEADARMPAAPAPTAQTPGE